MRRWILKRCLRHRVIVTLKTGDAFSGVFWEGDRECIVLKEAAALEANGSDRRPMTADGSIVLFRVDVSYMQFP